MITRSPSLNPESTSTRALSSTPRRTLRSSTTFSALTASTVASSPFRLTASSGIVSAFFFSRSDKRSCVRVAVGDDSGKRRHNARVVPHRPILLLVCLRHFQLLSGRGQLRLCTGGLTLGLEIFRLRVVHFLLCHQPGARIRRLFQPHVGRMRRCVC